MNECKISVVMAVYNGEQYLYEQLESIRSQSMIPDEVIICDDCSSDKSAEIIVSYIKKHNLSNSWHFETNSENLGYANNFHKGMCLAHGEYIFFCDQDDIWLPDKIECMADVMDNNPQIFTLASEYEPYYFTDDAPQISKSVTNRMNNDGSLEHLELSYRNIFINSEGCTMCIRRSLLEKTEKYWFSKWAHDEYVWKMAEVLDGLYFLHKTTLRRRLHSSNVSKRKMHTLDKRVPFLENLLASHNAMLKFAVEECLPEIKTNVIKRNIKATELRIELLMHKKYLNSLRLLFNYRNCYHSKKAIPVEFLMAVKGD